MKKILTTMILMGLVFSCVAASAEGMDAGDFAVSVKDGKSIAISYMDREMFNLSKIGIEYFKPDVDTAFGFFDFDKKDTKKKGLEYRAADGGALLSLEGKDVGKMTIETTGAGSLRVKISLDESVGAQAVLLMFGCADDDRFWGFGEQYNYVDFRGLSVPIWVSEQGVGRDEKPSVPYIGTYTESYFPMPYFMDPQKGKGFLIENTEYSKFNIAPKGRPMWMVEVWNGTEVSFLVFPGPAAADVISQLTAEVGRPKVVPPDWAFSGVWLSAQGGTEKVYARVDEALEAGIPISAVWSQDWVGARHFGGGNYGVRYRWVHDPEWYPGLEEKIKEYREKGVRFLGYFNPFVLLDNVHYEEMSEKGYLVKTRKGNTYEASLAFKVAMIDVSNPDAAEYFKKYARKAVEMGQSGWMADFGEWLPFNGEIANGDTRSVHNVYPTQWHRINREALEEGYPDGDFVMLTRSGYTGEQAVAHIVWAGDQEADFTGSDGMPTVVTAALTIGLAGVPFFTHDIAGFSGGPGTKELFLRWTEMGAFTPVMRTHDGLKKIENHIFNSDEETLEFFRKFALIHKELLPYIKELSVDALEKGWPLIRHTVLVDPDWDKAYDSHRQWMIGADILFAPVTGEGVTEIEVNFPAGEWEHLLTGEQYPGRQTATVSAPVGAPAIFVRSGKLNAVKERVREIYNGG